MKNETLVLSSHRPFSKDNIEHDDHQNRILGLYYVINFLKLSYNGGYRHCNRRICRCDRTEMASTLQVILSCTDNIGKFSLRQRNVPVHGKSLVQDTCILVLYWRDLKNHVPGILRNLIESKSSSSSNNSKK